MTITAKFASTCPMCGTWIEAGEKVEWSKGEKARHVNCDRSGADNQDLDDEAQMEAAHYAGVEGRDYWIIPEEDSFYVTNESKVCERSIVGVVGVHVLLDGFDVRGWTTHSNRELKGFKTVREAAAAVWAAR